MWVIENNENMYDIGDTMNDLEHVWTETFL